MLFFIVKKKNYRRFNSTKSNFPENSAFTIAELVVVISIMVVVSSMVLISFSGIRESASIRQAAEDLALELRKAQNMSLSVSPIPKTNGLIPNDVGVEITAGVNSYILFGDSGSNRFTIETIILPSDIAVNNISDQNGSRLYGSIDIKYNSPDATVVIPAETSVIITLKSKSQGFIKSVTASITGQISIQ